MDKENPQRVQKIERATSRPCERTVIVNALSYKETSAPAVEPVTLTQAKAQLVIESAFTEDDAMITRLIVAARQHVEKIMHRSIFNRNMTYWLDQFPVPYIFGTHGPFSGVFAWLGHYNRQVEIKVPKPGLQSITSITYLDSTMTEQTLDPSMYYVDVNSEPGRLRPVQGQIWPIANLYTPNAVTITYVSGTWGDGVEVNDCPQAVCQAMLLLISYWYKNRDAADPQPPKGIAMGVDALLAPHKVGTYLWN